MLPVGIKAPSFILLNQNGEEVSLEKFIGKKVVLYFYSKDMTGGCSKQAAGFKELYSQFIDKNTVIIGISGDSVASHKRFEEKLELPFILLSDPSKEIIEKYEVLGEKKLYGKTHIGVIRSTYLIDEKGIIIQSLRGVKAADNPKQMLDLV